jgi:hypothetical protein
MIMNWVRRGLFQLAFPAFSAGPRRLEQGVYGIQVVNITV